MLKISFLQFRNASLLHTLTQLTFKTDVLMLLSWNLHLTSIRNVRLGWCWRRGYSIASSRATCSVSLLFRHSLYYHLVAQCFCIYYTKFLHGNCACMVYYAASSGNFLLMFRDNLSVPSSGFKNPRFSLCNKPRREKFSATLWQKPEIMQSSYMFGHISWPSSGSYKFGQCVQSMWHLVIGNWQAVYI